MPLPQPLAWADIRANAHRFAHDYRDAVKENAEAQSFWNDFFAVFGTKRRGLAEFERPVRKTTPALPTGYVAKPAPALGRGRIDLFWPGVLLAESKSRHANLEAAYAQALEYLGDLPDHERPQYIFTSDFARLRLYDLRGRTTYPNAADHTEIPVAALGQHVRLFGFMAGYEQRRYQEQDPVNRLAAERMGRLHDQLEQAGYRGPDLERYLVRLLFCLFAEDTDIFPRASFMDLVSRYAGPKGQQLGPLLHQLFEVLDTPEDQRPPTLPEHLRDFPYVNGDLFKGGLRTVAFDEAMRELLLDATRLDWGQISPAIFGSMFQSVMSPDERREHGAHYTSEANILKAIGPLFLDAHAARLARLAARVPSPERTRDLAELHRDLAALRLLDPACGCGNFLVVAYRELRQLELDLLALRYPDTGGTQFPLGVETAVQLSVEQMHGIELDEFAARIAEVALWLVDHQMNQRLSVRFGHYLARIPLRQRAHIRHANALTTDWNEVLPREQATHIVGNPPFVGAKLMTAQQRQELLAVAGPLNNAGLLDYVAAWYLKAAQYTQGTAIQAAFVSTNSISQGEQVAVLWKALLYDYKQHVHFAHQTFKWANEGRRNAAVYCVIVGFGPQELAEPLRLFLYENPTSAPQELTVSRLNPYLVDAPDALIGRRQMPLCDVPNIYFGNMPLDGGNLLLTDSEKNDLLAHEPEAAPLLRRFTGAEEFLHNIPRWCLWLADAAPSLLRRLPKVLARVERVRAFRLASVAPSTRRFAETPTLFRDRRVSDQYLLIPCHSSETRQYIPIGFLSKEVIANNAVLTFPDATLYHFAVLTSAMHMAWMRVVCGRLESRYRYSKDIVYNNFPWPAAPDAAARQAVEAAAQAVLDARAAHPDSTLADLYHPLAMPATLRSAHQRLDRLVDQLYRRKPFRHDTERVQLLFERYAELSAPLAPAPAPPPRPRRR